jgi:hypothetical protein
VSITFGVTEWSGSIDAAPFYFDKPVVQLSKEQYLGTIEMLHEQYRFDPRTHPNENAKRVAGLNHLVRNCRKNNGCP